MGLLASLAFWILAGTVDTVATQVRTSQFLPFRVQIHFLWNNVINDLGLTLRNPAERAELEKGEIGSGSGLSRTAPSGFTGIDITVLRHDLAYFHDDQSFSISLSLRVRFRNSQLLSTRRLTAWIGWTSRSRARLLPKSPYGRMRQESRFALSR
jgi:hypothetical protein